jgi:hypothetical protein
MGLLVAARVTVVTTSARVVTTRAKGTEMAKYRIYVTTTASGTVDIEVPDDVTDPTEIVERAFDEGEFPSLSAQGTGWGRPWSMDLGDWEIETENGIPYVTDENGEQVKATES